MSTKKFVFITGATGFVGSAIVKRLRESGFVVQGLSRKERSTDEGVRWVCGDIRNSDALFNVLEGCEVVVNAAGKTGEPEDSESIKDFFSVNQSAAGRLAWVAREAGVKKFIHVSSTGVFGHGKGEYTEKSMPSPETAYERSKLAGETEVLAQTCKDFSVTVIRPSNIFGEHHPWDKLLTWLRTVKCRRTVLVGDPARYWVNYVYIGDVSEFVKQLVSDNLGTANYPAGKLVNINTPLSVLDFYKASSRALEITTNQISIPRPMLMATANLLDLLSGIVGKPFPLTSGKVRELCNEQVFCSTSAYLKQSGFPFVGIMEGLRRTCKHYEHRGLL